MKLRKVLLDSNVLIQLKQIQIDNLFMEKRKLESQIFYEDKKSYFKKLLAQSQSLISSYEYYCSKQDSVHLDVQSRFFNFFPNIENHYAKEDILSKLISVSDKLILHYDNQDLKDEFKKLELELHNYLDGYDLLVFHLGRISKASNTSDLKVQLHYIKNELYFSLRNKFLAVSRDLRQSFRDIIKFLFKNMDDESHDHNALKTNFLTALYYQNKHFHHGKERNHRPFELRTG